MGFPSGGGGGSGIYQVPSNIDPTGVKDSTAGLQAAFNNVTAPVYIPPGDYSTTGLTIPANATILGFNSQSYGPAQTTGQRSRIFLAAGSTKPLISTDDTTVVATNIRLRDLWLDGNFVGPDCLVFGNLSSNTDRFSYVERCYITNGGTESGAAGISGEAAYIGTNVSTVKLFQCVIKWQSTTSLTSGEGIRVSGNNINIDSCLVGSFQGSSNPSGIDLGSGWDSRVVNCDVFDCSRGITVAGFGQVVSDCGLDHHIQMAILCYSGYSTISNNHFHSNSQGGSGGSPDIDVANNNTIGLVVEGNNFAPLDGGITNLVSYAVSQAGTGNLLIIRNNSYAPGRATLGETNYTGIQTTPAIPASGTAFAALAYDADWIFTDTSTGTSVVVDGITHDIAASSTQSIFVRAGAAPTPTYTTAPTLAVINR